MDGDKAFQVLNRQPPLAKFVLVQIINHDKAYNDGSALVLVSPYIEEQTYILEEGSLDLGQVPMVTFQDKQYNMDLNTLLFVAGQGRGEMPQASKKLKNAP